MATAMHGQTGDSVPFAAIDAYVTAALRADRVPAAAWAVVHGDSIVHLRGVGAASDGTPVTGATPFVLGSMSKTFTALAIMQLVEEGRIDLDAPVQRYLSWFRVADTAASSVITVRQLLLHTSGIPTSADRATGANRTLTAQVRALQRVPLSSSPGTVHQYASPNYLVLGAIIEAVTGASYATRVQRTILTPLGMTHSFVDQRAAIADGMTEGHRYWFGFPVAATLPHEHDRLPTAALISSAGDLARFLIAQRVGVRGGVLSSAGLSAMQTGVIDADGFAYGFGWRVSRLNGVRAVHHGGIVPNFRGKMIMLPDSGWGVVVLTNASSSLPLPIVPTSHRIADAVAGYLVGAPLDDGRSRFRLVHWALLVGTMLVLLSQARGLWRLRARAGDPPTRRSLLRAALLDTGWVLFAVLWLPRLVGITWPEMFRGSPDLAWWLVVTLALSVATVVARARRLTTS
jgi:CubicO group peptidase (beta-lactamase class C family)